MNTEWLVFFLLLTLALSLISVKARYFSHYFGALSKAVVLLVVVLFAVRAHAWWKSTLQNGESVARLLEAVPAKGRPGGYVSSDKCEACHPSQYASWHRTYHRTMTQHATPSSVQGRFDGVTLALDGQTYRLERRGDEFWVEMEDPDWHFEHLTSSHAPGLASAGRPARVARRIGMLTGSHHMQAYWVPSRAGNLQLFFPFTWILEDQRWVPSKDTFLRDPKAAPQMPAWNFTCIQCHSTGGQPQPEKLEVVASRVGELGIACEACHGPGEEHVRQNQDPLRRYRLHGEEKPDPTIVNPSRLPGKLSAQVCGQCHGIKWVDDKKDWYQHGFRYRPGDELEKTNPIIRRKKVEEELEQSLKSKERPPFDQMYWKDGTVRVIGREFSGLIESACYQRGDLSCLGCHSMHKSDPDDQLAGRGDTNEACLPCHEPYLKKLTEHTHHGPGSSGSQCYNCHMPHTVYGLLKANSSHLIDSPSVEVSLKTGRPNACNLCHLDRSLGWTAKHLSDWYKKPAVSLSQEEGTLSAAVAWLLRGDAGQRALIAWHMGWKPALEASGIAWLPPYLAVLLEDPYSAVRYIAHKSLTKLPGYEDFAYDYVDAPEERARARQRALGLWTEKHAKPIEHADPALLLEPSGALQQETIDRLLKQRDNRYMDLQE